MMRLLLVLMAWSGATLLAPMAAFASSAESLANRFESLRGHSLEADSPTPVYVKSSTGGRRLSADVYSVVGRPFEAFAARVDHPAKWCEFVPVTLNVKACTHKGEAPGLLTLYLGRKEYQTPGDAYRLSYEFRQVSRHSDYLRLELHADSGPLGTSDYRIELEAADYEGSSLVRIHSSYVPSWRSEMATSLYLATLGRNKVGFSVEDSSEEGRSRYVGGVQGIVERNVMRYYLALRAYLQTGHLARNERFEARIRRWFEMTERYARQLHELERREYLRAKRRERANQQRLQSKIDSRPAAIARN